MLRTQEAALYGIGENAMSVLCEAICLDAVEVAAVGRVSIWFFDETGNLVCQRLLDAREGRFHEGAVIPRSATAAYVKAASAGLAALTTEDAPVLEHDNAMPADVTARLDLLLVDNKNQPAAIFRCERYDAAGEWRERDIIILRKLAQTLATAIRHECERYVACQTVPAVPSVLLAPTGSARQNLDWLRKGKEPSIWLQSLPAASVYDALDFDLPPVLSGDDEPDWDN
ncbi:hypothetical protein [Ferrovibrio sp.]|uniref:hypothetical protein n=1 Tax=Ferrovibrio sp. TaxID=1917215 RepID=UPI002628545F|nr:hypothetical protein [Ferrovibrio sp.]